MGKKRIVLFGWLFFCQTSSQKCQGSGKKKDFLFYICRSVLFFGRLSGGSVATPTITTTKRQHNKKTTKQTQTNQQKAWLGCCGALQAHITLNLPKPKQNQNQKRTNINKQTNKHTHTTPLVSSRCKSRQATSANGPSYGKVPS